MTEKTNGTAPGKPRLTTGTKAYEVTYTCPQCEHTLSSRVQVGPGAPAVQVPDFRCPHCPTLPVMNIGGPREVAVSRIHKPGPGPFAVPAQNS